MKWQASQHVADLGRRVPPVGRWKGAAMSAGHRDRQEDRLVAGIAGALEAVHLIYFDAFRSRPARAAVTAQPTIFDRKLLDPTAILQLSHTLDERVHRLGHRSTLRVAPP